ncbi:tudor domain-containing protein 1-like [Bolinopsis microptera]|uniref:tudor domain-containing protein 1-like n=1 Tax=Bolinopsis microptera TaxID=2820187 RepID=UPI00307A8802
MRGGGFHNSLRGKGPSSLTRPVDKTNQQSSNNNENDRNNKNRFPPSSISPKKDLRGRDGSNWSSFQNSGASACEQAPDSGPRTDMDSWDPLRDDFKNNKFSDRDFKRGGNNDPSVHVSQIPPQINEDGLRNLFVDKLPHFKPTRVSVPSMKEGHKTKIGFVHYQTLDQCQEAIRLMSGHPLGSSFLRVHLGKKFLNMKQGGDNLRNGGDNLRNGGDNFRNGGDNFRNGGDNFRNGGDNFRNGGDNFRSRGSEMSPNRTNGRSPKGSVSSVSRRASPGIFSTRADVLNGGNQTSVKLSEPVDKTFCAKCKMPATNACGPCEGLTFYCGSTCQMADWPAHQLICVGSIGSKPNQQHKDIQQNGPSIPRAPISPEPIKPLKMTSLPKISIPDSCKCLWVSGCSPLQFHVQLTDNQEVIENIIETMYSLCPEQPAPSHFKPEVGDVISALYNDGNWYRAEVLTTGEDKIKVRMFDFATEDEVRVQDIRPTAHLVHVMPQAVPCRLHDLLVPNEHSEQVLQFFSSHLQQSGSELKLSKVDEVDGVFRVNLTLVSGEDLGDLMVANGHASRASGPKKNPYISIDDTRDQIVLDKAYPANVSYITNLKECYENKAEGDEEAEGEEVLDLCDVVTVGQFLSSSVV